MASLGPAIDNVTPIGLVLLVVWSLVPTASRLIVHPVLLASSAYQTLQPAVAIVSLTIVNVVPLDVVTPNVYPQSLVKLVAASVTKQLVKMPPAQPKQKIFPPLIGRVTLDMWFPAPFVIPNTTK
jgi:hypothetical protein